MAHECILGYPDLLAAKSVINTREGVLIWRDKRLSLILYTFKDHINIQFIDWEGDRQSLDTPSCATSQCLITDGICLPVENRELFVELLQINSDVFF